MCEEKDNEQIKDDAYWERVERLGDCLTSPEHHPPHPEADDHDESQFV